MGGQPFRDHFNVIPLNDFLAVLRGQQPPNPASGDVPSELALRTPQEVDGNWGDAKIIKYSPTQNDITNDIRAQQGLITLNGSGRRPITLTIDSDIASAAGSGSATYPAAKDAAGNKLSYRAQLLISYGVSYGATGWRTDSFAVDIGSRVTLAANLLSVNAIALAPPAGYVAGSMNIGAIVGLHAGESQVPALSTSYVDALSNVAPNNVATLIIPNKSNAIWPIQCSDFAGFWQLDFQDQAGGPITSLQMSAGQQVAPIPIASSDYYQMVITNLGTKAVGFRVPFMLSL